MAGSARSVLRTLVLSNDFDSATHSTNANRYLNEALAKIRRRVYAGSEEQTTTVTLSTAQDYTIAVSYARLGSVFLTDPWTQLREVDWDDIDPTHPATGTPSVFALRGTTLRLDTKPGAIGTLTLRYWRTAAEMDDDADTSGLPTEYEDALVVYARAKLFREEDDIPMRDALMAEFNSEVDEMRRDLQNSNTRTRKRQIPGMWADSYSPSPTYRLP